MNKVCRTQLPKQIIIIC